MPPTPLGSLGAKYVAAAEAKTETLPENVGHASKETSFDVILLSGYS
jgi:hypothetical protein